MEGSEFMRLTVIFGNKSIGSHSVVVVVELLPHAWACSELLLNREQSVVGTSSA